nr:oligosaccharide flippase family protein [Arthrobacter ruber]
MLYSSIAGMASLCASLVLFPIALSTVGAPLYGMWLFVLAITSYLAYADLGVGGALVHFGSRSRGGDASLPVATLLSSAIVWCLSISLLMAPVAYLIFNHYVGIQSEKTHLSSADAAVLVVCGVLVVCLMIVRPFSSALQGAGMLVLERKLQLIGVAVRIAGTLIACTVLGTFYALVIAETIALAVPPCLAACILLRNHWRHLRFDRKMLSTLVEMLQYSVRSFVVSLAGNSILQGGTLVVGLVAGPAQVSYYNAAFRIYAGVRQISSWAVEPFRSSLSRTFYKSASEAEDLIRTLIRMSTLLVSFGCLFLMFGAAPLLRLWLGEAVPIDAVSFVLIILLGGLMLNSLHSVLILASDTANKPGLFTREQVTWAVSFFVLGFIFGNLWGAVGVAAALSLPLVILEFSYVRRAEQITHLRGRDWWCFCILPIVALFGGGSLVSLILVAYLPGTVWNGFMPCVAFAFCSAVLTYLLRRLVPFREFRTLLASKL